ncbi:MAG: hypothetical protein K5662_01030 [Lachnospiraceae bacterium]|nr:hypothetical protein [Lachnospiraceae bacterium]
MKERMQRIIDNFHKYNSENLAFQVFGFSNDCVYDALVVAPGYSPYKLHMDEYCKVTTLREGAYTAGYLVEKDGRTIAWIRTGSSAGNTIDHMAICAELKIKKMIFTGAVGALKEEFSLGDVCTPKFCISGGMANTYLKDSLRDFVPFERVYPDEKYIDQVIKLGDERGHTIKKASVFCTDSVALEYSHLDEIKEFGTDLIEMETASFYLMADLMEVPGVALLVVSDNSASGVALVGHTEEEQLQYEHGRCKVIPDMILGITGEDGISCTIKTAEL